MEAEGKTWNYHDILAQFITMHNKKSNVLLIFFKQKTAYEMCGRDWSSDVCSSDLLDFGILGISGVDSDGSLLEFDYQDRKSVV